MSGRDVRGAVSGGNSGPASISDVRQRNRAQALRSVILAGSTSRAELARTSGLSVASITSIVSELIADGLVVEAGTVASNGGRPVTLLAPNPTGAYFLGADVGERGVAVELFDLSMTRVDREFIVSSKGEPVEAIAVDLARSLTAIRDRNAVAWPGVVGLGLGLHGLVESGPSGEQVLYAQSLGWPPIPVAELVSFDLPVFAENGAKAQAMAEMWDGAVQGIGEALVVLLGRGVGLGIVSGGKLARGLMGSAGEWGHTKIVRNGRLCRCGARGCVEAYLGADAVLTSWREAGGEFEDSGWRAVGELFAAAEAGDPIATSVVDELVATLGSALGGMVNLTNPQRIVLGGWVGVHFMGSLAARVEAAIRAEALGRPGSQFDLVGCRFEGDTVARGAAIMPLEALLVAPRRSQL